MSPACREKFVCSHGSTIGQDRIARKHASVSTDGFSTNLEILRNSCTSHRSRIAFFELGSAVSW
jgi:hypothetical protein